MRPKVKTTQSQSFCFQGSVKVRTTGSGRQKMAISRAALMVVSASIFGRWGMHQRSDSGIERSQNAWIGRQAMMLLTNTHNK